MSGQSGFRRSVHLAAFAAACLCLLLSPASARSRHYNNQHGEPGQFDFYVLALSWSPSYCEASQERSPNRAPDPAQCGPRPFSFVVHGLWPQYEKGFPAFCQVPAPRLFHGIVDEMLDIMPSKQLVYHEWDRHGTCSGLPAKAFFETVRKARAAVTIPEQYLKVATPITVTPGDVADAFVKANPGLSRSGFAVACDRKRLTELRICLTKDLAFRECGEVVRANCRNDKMLMPAIRGGGKAEAR